MDKFFNSDNMVMRTLSKIFDIGWLTLIYLVFCIPIVTVGAATTSLYYVSAKVLRHNRSYVWREFWHSFKTNFLQSTIAWVVTAIIVVLLWLNMNIVAETGGEKGGYLIGAYYALLFIILCISCYIYPIISRFGTKFSQILRLSLYCAFRHFLHTLLMLVILVATVALIWLGDKRGACFHFCAGCCFSFVHVPNGACHEKIYAKRREKIHRRWGRNCSLV